MVAGTLIITFLSVCYHVPSHRGAFEANYTSDIVLLQSDSSLDTSGSNYSVVQRFSTTPWHHKLRAYPWTILR